MTFLNNNSEEARIIQEALSPDNLTTPPMSISSSWDESKVNLHIKDIQNIDTAIATVNDILESYKLSKEILERLDKNV